MRKQILIRPLITEKNTSLQEALNQYVFEVSKDSNRIEIAKAVADKFKVRVEGVKTAVIKGKRKSCCNQREKKISVHKTGKI